MMKFATVLSVATRVVAGGLAANAVVMGHDAQAADIAIKMPVKAPAIARFDWSGPYFGGHIGYGRGQARSTLFDPDPTEASNSFGSLFGGAQVGYNFVSSSSRFLLGIEADITFPNFLSADDVVSSRTTPQTDITRKVDSIGTVRGRLGRTFDHW